MGYVVVSGSSVYDDLEVSIVDLSKTQYSSFMEYMIGEVFCDDWNEEDGEFDLELYKEWYCNEYNEWEGLEEDSKYMSMKGDEGIEVSYEYVDDLSELER